jgi:hypothetical protein
VPTRRPNAELHTREHLTAAEVETLLKAAKANQHGHRDTTMILIAFRHGLRPAEPATCEAPGRNHPVRGFNQRPEAAAVASVAVVAAASAVAGRRVRR